MIEIRKNNNLKITPSSCIDHCEFYGICDGCLAEKLKNVNPKCEYSLI